MLSMSFRKYLIDNDLVAELDAGVLLEFIKARAITRWNLTFFCLTHCHNSQRLVALSRQIFFIAYA